MTLAIIVVVSFVFGFCWFCVFVIEWMWIDLWVLLGLVAC